MGINENSKHVQKQRKFMQLNYCKTHINNNSEQY